MKSTKVKTTKYMMYKNDRHRSMRVMKFLCFNLCLGEVCTDGGANTDANANANANDDANHNDDDNA